MDKESAALKAAILERCRSIYEFCARSGLPKGTVYQVLRGRYQGDAAEQRERIRRALDGASGDASALREIVAAVACERCPRSKRLCRKARAQCAAVWDEQARAIARNWRRR